MVEGRAHAVGEAVGIDAHFTLGNGALVIAVQELNRRFDGDDVAPARGVGVQVMDERGDGARASGSRDAGDENEAEFAEGGIGDIGGESQLFDGRQHVWDDAHDNGVTGALLENGDAESGDARGAPWA